MTSGAKAAGRFGKQDFVYIAADDVYRCPAGERLTYRYQSEEDGKTIRRYWTSTCKTCALKAQCTTGLERRMSRWEHEAVLEKVQKRLDQNPDAMGVRRQTAEHPFGTIKCWMGATHFLTKKLPKVATEVALNVLAYNMKWVMAIAGVGGLLPRDAYLRPSLTRPNQHLQEGAREVPRGRSYRITSSPRAKCAIAARLRACRVIFHTAWVHC
jgi:Transposase DDE domain